MFRSLALATFAVATFGATAKADPVIFQPFGNNSTQIAIAGFDPAPGNILNVGVNTAATAFVGAGYNPANGNNINSGPGVFQFTSFGQSAISTALNPTSGGLPINLPAGTNLTMVFGATERLINVTGNVGTGGATATSVLDGNNNYFQLYAGNTGTNNLSGLGFNNGTLILSGTLTGLTNPLVITNQSGNAGALDQFPNNNPANDNYPGLTTVGTSGNTGITVHVNSFNPNYFVLAPGQKFDDFVISSQFQAPFNGVDPSAAFLTGSLTSALGQAPTTAGAGLPLGNTGPLGIGTVNGGPPGTTGGPSVQIQSDANFNLSVSGGVTQVPEPTTLAVFAGLMGIGGLVYRRKSKVTA